MSLLIMAGWIILFCIESTNPKQPFLPESFVGELRRRDQLETLELAKVCRIAEHVDVEQLGHVPASPHGVFLTEGVADVSAFLVDDGTFVGGGSGRTDLPDQVPKSHRRRHLDLFQVKKALIVEKTGQQEIKRLKYAQEQPGLFRQKNVTGRITLSTASATICLAFWTMSASLSCGAKLILKSEKGPLQKNGSAAFFGKLQAKHGRN